MGPRRLLAPAEWADPAALGGSVHRIGDDDRAVGQWNLFRRWAPIAGGHILDYAGDKHQTAHVNGAKVGSASGSGRKRYEFEVTASG